MFGEARIDNIDDAVDGERRFGDVSGANAFSAIRWGRFEYFFVAVLVVTRSKVEDI